jgi:hypothetical protein
MLTCKDASHLISEREDRSLTWRERLGLRLHVWICANCRRFGAQMAMMRQALKALAIRRAQESSTAHLSEQAKGRIRQRVNAAGRDTDAS